MPILFHPWASTWLIVIGLCATGCAHAPVDRPAASAPVSETALCEGLAGALAAHAGALAEDGGARAVHSGAHLIALIDAGCGADMP